MRRLLVVIGAVALATAALAGAASAAPAQHISDTQSGIACEGLANEAGTAFTFVVASDTFGSFGELAFWAAPATPRTGAPTWISGASAVMVEGASVSAVFELFELGPAPDPSEPPFGDPVGEATLVATITPLGDPQPYESRGRDGNRVFRIEGVLQEMSVSGTLELPGGISFDLSSCFGFRDTFTSFSNAPAATIFRSSEFQLNCIWPLEDAFIYLFASGGEFGAFADIGVSDASGDLFGATEPTLTTEVFGATFELFEFTEEGMIGPVGTAEASATLSATGERFRESFRFGNTKVIHSGEVYAVSGTLAITTPTANYELAMDGESCFAADLRRMEHQSARQGPRGRPLPNDEPTGALPIAIGETTSVRTGGTDPDPEEPCLADDGGEFPIGRTAWWSFEGTGGAVTVDTAGSDFDTVVGVYVGEDGALVGVGCVDDVETFEAVITVDTLAGVTYYVQAGGYGGSAGTLILSVY